MWSSSQFLQNSVQLQSNYLFYTQVVNLIPGNEMWFITIWRNLQFNVFLTHIDTFIIGISAIKPWDAFWTGVSLLFFAGHVPSGRLQDQIQSGQFVLYTHKHTHTHKHIHTHTNTHAHSKNETWVWPGGKKNKKHAVSAFSSLTNKCPPGGGVQAVSQWEGDDGTFYCLNKEDDLHRQPESISQLKCFSLNLNITCVMKLNPMTVVCFKMWVNGWNTWTHSLSMWLLYILDMCTCGCRPLELSDSNSTSLCRVQNHHTSSLHTFRGCHSECSRITQGINAILYGS